MSLLVKIHGGGDKMKTIEPIVFHNNAIYIQVALKDTAHLGHPNNKFYEAFYKKLLAQLRAAKNEE